MTDVRNERERNETLRAILERPLPFRVRVDAGGRTLDQNALAFRWTAMQAHFRTRGVLLTGWDQGFDQYPEQRRRAS